MDFESYNKPADVQKHASNQYFTCQVKTRKVYRQSYIHNQLLSFV